MNLKHIHMFESDFEINVKRTTNKIKVSVISSDGKMIFEKICKQGDVLNINI